MLRPGGHAFLEFYNPRSLRGLGYRMRSRLDRSEPVFVRFDTLADVLTYLPKELTYRSARHPGVRSERALLSLAGRPHDLRMARPSRCDTAIGRRYGGYLMIELARA